MRFGKARTDHAQIHNFYKSQFSVVDKANQHEFGTGHSGRCMRETTQMIHGLMKVPFTNISCILDFENKKKKKLNFVEICEQIALHLI